MATTAHNVDLRFRGQDSGVSQTVQNVTSRLDQMPSAFGRGAAAMSSLGTASGQLGGRVADLGGKFADLGLLMAAGGPLGIAIGATTLAITAGVAVWESYTAAEVATENATKSLNAAFREAATRTSNYRQHIKDLEKEIANLGKTQGQIQRQDLAETIQMQELGIDTLENEISKLKARQQVARANADATRNMQSGFDRLIGAGDRAIEVHEAEAEALEKQIGQFEKALTRAKDMQSMREKEIALSKRKEARERKLAEEAAERGRIEREHQQFVLANQKMFADMDDETIDRAQDQSVALADLSENNAAIELARLKEIANERKIAAAERKRLAEEAARHEAEMTKLWSDAQRTAILGVSAAMGNAFGLMISDSENAGKHMTKAVIESAKAAIMAYASAGAAASAAANAGIPGFGWIAAIAGANIVFGVISGFLDKIPSFQRGGVVRGPDTGRDNVIAALRGNERVFTPEDNERIVRAIERGSGGGGGVHLHQHTVVPLTSPEMMKQVGAVRKMQKQLERLGLA